MVFLFESVACLAVDAAVFLEIVIDDVLIQASATDHGDVFVVPVFESEVEQADRPLWVAVEDLHEFSFFLVQVRVYKFQAALELGLGALVEVAQAVCVRFQPRFNVFVETVEEVKLVQKLDPLVVVVVFVLNGFVREAFLQLLDDFGPDLLALAGEH